MPFPIYSSAFLKAHGITPSSGSILTPAVVAGTVVVIRNITAIGSSGSQDSANIWVTDGLGDDVYIWFINPNNTEPDFSSYSQEFRIVLTPGQQLGLLVSRGTMDFTVNGYSLTA